jgi:hypothetical protein
MVEGPIKFSFDFPSGRTNFFAGTFSVFHLASTCVATRPSKSSDGRMPVYKCAYKIQLHFIIFIAIVIIKNINLFSQQTQIFVSVSFQKVQITFIFVWSSFIFSFCKSEKSYSLHDVLFKWSNIFTTVLPN